jgi:uncharacterized OsmC-like protein
MDQIRTALEGASAYLTANPSEATYTDSAATAVLGEGLVVNVTGPDGASITTDMSRSVGGAASAPSPGFYLRAAQASCVAVVIGMRAAQEGVRLEHLEVIVDSTSDDRGILGLDPAIPAGPIRSRVRVVAKGDASRQRLDEIVRWGIDHCPVCDAVKRAVPIDVEVEIR